jgi:D-proline reductase (dithiol) PrdB
MKIRTAMNNQVDSYRFISRATARIMKAWVKREPNRDTPWTPLSNPLAQSTIALISSAGMALKDDKPFDQEGERKNPWWGDPSFRTIPRTAAENDVCCYHLHVDSRYADQDINCIFPLRRLEEQMENGEIGRIAPSHYSIMGYILQEQELLQESAPAIISCLKSENVDIVLLIPV